MKDIIVHQNKDGSYTATRKGGAFKGTGESSVQALGNLLEREAPSPKKEEA